MQANGRFVSIHEAAPELGVPLTWLKSEADAGRIPSLKVNRRLLFNVQQVEQTLSSRAEANLATLNLTEAADMLGLNEAVLRDRANRRQIPCQFSPTGRMKFDRYELLEWFWRAHRQREGSPQ